MAKNKVEEFDSELFETRLESLKDSQESIMSLSNWCMENRQHHKKIVVCWLNVIKRVRMETRLALYYLANDVIQYSKRKRLEFVDSWTTALQRATTFVRDEKVKPKIERILKIWDEREIFSKDFIADLTGLLHATTSKTVAQAAVVSAENSDEFQTATLINSIREVEILASNTDYSFKRLGKAPELDLEVVNQQLKDRAHCLEMEKEVERYIAFCETYTRNLHLETKHRKKLIKYVETAQDFYAQQRKDVKVVVQAYKSFGNRLKAVKKKVAEVVPNLPSPMPSPDINAPSPERDADLQLPDEQAPTPNSSQKTAYNGNYLEAKLPFNLQDFKKESTSRPIEVIGTRAEEKPDASFAATGLGFYKPASSITAYTTDDNVQIPGLSSGPLPVPPVQNEYSSLARSADHYTDLFRQNHLSNSLNRAYGPVAPPAYGSGNGYHASSAYESAAGLSGAPPLPRMPPSGPAAARGLVEGVHEEADLDSTWNMEMSWTGSILNSSSGSAAYDPNDSLHTDVRDVDHRQLHLAGNAVSPNLLTQKLGLSKEKTRQLDIDHRNLISLTGSPSITENETPSGNKFLKPVDMDFRKGQYFPTGDVDYRGLGQVIQTISTTNPALPPSVEPPPPPPPTYPHTPSNNNKVLSPPSPPNENNTAVAACPQNTEHLDADPNAAYEPSDMVQDMDMSDEDLEEVLREVHEEELLGHAAANVPVQENVLQPALLEPNVEVKRPPLLATPEEYVPEAVWESDEPDGLAYAEESNEMINNQAEPEWNQNQMPYGMRGAGESDGMPWQQNPPFFHPGQNMMPNYPPQQFRPHFAPYMERGMRPRGPRGPHIRGWGNAPIMNPFRNGPGGPPHPDAAGPYFNPRVRPGMSYRRRGPRRI